MLTPLFNPHIGGVETHVEEVSKRLAKMGYEVTVVTSRFSPDLESEEEIKGFRLLRVGPDIARSILTIASKNDLSRTGIVQVHDYSVFFKWLMPLTPLVPKQRIFITFHGYEGTCPPSPRAMRMRAIAESKSKGNMIVGAYIHKWYGTFPTMVSYGGTSPVGTGLHKDLLRAVFVGRLERDTSLRKYLEALRMMRNEEGFSYHLDVCGNGSMMKELRDFSVAEKLDVSFHGFVRDAAGFYERAGVAFVPGYLSILEAMSHGCIPVATFDNPLKNDYYQLLPFRRLLSISETPEEIYRQLINLLGDRKRMVKRMKMARAFASNRTWDKVVMAYIRLWGLEESG